MIKKFLSEHTQFAIRIQHLGINGGCWEVELYNTTYDPYEPVFKHYISDQTADMLSGDFDILVMVPIKNWYEKFEEGRKK